jgi:hypothetical protein
MKKQIILTWLLLNLVALAGQTQHTFQKTISKPYLQTIYDVKEDADKNLLLVGRVINDNRSMGYVIKLSRDGELLHSKTFPFGSKASLFFNLHVLYNQYIIFGHISDSQNQDLLYLKLDQELEITDQKNLTLFPNFGISYINSIIDSDNNFVLSGYTSGSNTNPYYYKLSQEGDSIVSFLHENEHILSKSFDIIERPNNKGYYSFCSHLDGPLGDPPGSMLKLNKSFEIEEKFYIPMLAFNNYSPIKTGNDIIINTNKFRAMPGSDDNDIILMKIDTVANPMYDHPLGMLGDTNDYAPYMNGTSQVGLTDFYASGTANLIEYDPFYGNGQNNWIMLGKFSANLEEYWLKYFGGDAYYHTYSMTTTSDHGCLVVATRYDDEHPENDRDIYVLKVNDEGLVTWDETIQPSADVYKVYPNPGNNVLNLDLREKRFVFQLYNNTGQLVLSKENQRSINTSAMSRGIYFYRIIKDGEILSSGKWVKR